jgi:hypothetical protein
VARRPAETAPPPAPTLVARKKTWGNDPLEGLELGPGDSKL